MFTKKRRFVLGLLVLVLAAGACALALAPPHGSASATASAGAMPSAKAMGDFAQFLLRAAGLATVLLLVLLFLLKRQRNALGRHSGGDAWLRIRGRRALGPKKAVYCVEAFGRVLVLGVTEHQISVLLDLDRAELSEEQRQLWQEGNGSDPAFKQLLQQWMRR